MVDASSCQPPVVRLTHWPLGADLAVHGQIALDHGKPTVSATMTAQDEKPTAFEARVSDAQQGATQLASLTSAFLDASICDDADLPADARACHCAVAGQQYFARAPADAVRLLEQAVRLAPREPSFYPLLAATQIAHAQDAEARETLRLGLQLVGDPDSVAGLAIRRRQAQLDRDYAEEERVIARLRRLEPTNARWVALQANFMLEHRRDCARASALIAGLADTALANEGEILSIECKIRCGAVEEAIAASRELLAHHPDDWFLLMRAATYESLAGNYERARDDADRAVILRRDRPEALWARAQVEVEVGNYLEAEVWLDEALAATQVEQNRIFARLSQAELYLRWNRPEDALAIVEDPEVAKAMDDLLPLWLEGRALLALGRPDEADAILQRMIAEQSGRGTYKQSEYIHHLQGSIHLHRSELQQAIHQFGLATASASVSAPFLRDTEAKAFLRAGEPERALATWNEGLAVNPHHPWSHCGIARTYEAMGDRERALAHYREAFAIFGRNPDDADGQRCMAQFHLLENKLD
jgi:predicted Zn-dependent protease